LGGQQLSTAGATASAVGTATALEELPVPGDQIAVAVDDLAAVVHRPAQTRALEKRV